jgi:multiple sugar transport system permease protein
MSATALPRKSLNTGRVIGYLIRYLIILAALIFFLFPIFWVATMAVKTPEEYFHTPPIWFPRGLDLSHFAQLVTNKSIVSLGHSLIITTSSTLLALLLGCPAAYSLARFNTGGHNFAFWILSQRFLPPVAVVFPIFLLFRTLQWVDTYHGLILLYTTFNLPFVVWMMRGYFWDVPVEIEESALVDGCSRLRTLWFITLPLSLPGVIATGVFTFIFSWNEFLFALVLTRINVVTLPVALTSYFGPQSAFWGEAAALSLIATVPVLALTLLVHRHLVTGLTLGAFK